MNMVNVFTAECEGSFKAIAQIKKKIRPKVKVIGKPTRWKQKYRGGTRSISKINQNVLSGKILLCIAL